mgnify:CR=1 FL=1
MGETAFPNESEDYRAARRALLESEMKLRALTEEVAAQRRGVFAALTGGGHGSAAACVVAGLVEGAAHYSRDLFRVSYLGGPLGEQPHHLG